MKHNQYLRILIIFVFAFFSSLSILAQSDDSDGDGVSNSIDQCPNQYGPKSNNGCPVTAIIVLPPADSDGDGVPDDKDKCPNQVGSVDNGGCPPSSANPDTKPPSNNPPPSSPDGGAVPPANDRDGDGIDDGKDQCPDEYGTVEFNGCPPPVAVPQFQPPLLSNDACYVTASADNRIRVRVAPSLDAEHIGYLVQGVIYEAQGIVINDSGQWVKLAGDFQHLNYEMWGGTDGYVSDDVVLTSNCPELDTGGGTGEIQLPIDSYACTMTTPFNWIFAFNYAPGEVVPFGSHPIAIINGDLEDKGDANLWTTSLEIYDGTEYEYLNYADGTALYRIGGDCGWQDNVGARAPHHKIQIGQDGDPTLDILSAVVPEDFPNTKWLMVFGEQDTSSDTVEYCVWQEVQEAGVFEEVCYEIEVPEGCTLVSAEAGVYTLECDEEDPVTLNPLLDGLPALDLSGKPDTSHFGVQLRFALGGPGANGGEQPETVEYCVWQEVQEAGVFEEVCYEIEIPEGCTLVSAEAGVFTLDCEGDDVEVNPALDGMPSNLQAEQRPGATEMQKQERVLGEFCENYVIWWETDEAGNPIPSTIQGACMEWSKD